MKTALLDVRDVISGYSGNTVHAPVSFSLEKGEVQLLSGLNGSGKTTLLKTLAGLMPALGGLVLLNGNDIAGMSSTARAGHLSVMFTSRIGGLGMTVEELFEVTMHGLVNRVSGESMEECIREFDLQRLRHKSLLRLSDGEYQRVMFARAIAQGSPLILLDEPNAHLDYKAREEFCSHIQRLTAAGRHAFVIATHDRTMGLAATQTVMS
ncbi:MAG: ABC transporter ATP-binding protein [Flavobacteriales bacterium]